MAIIYLTLPHMIKLLKPTTFFFLLLLTINAFPMKLVVDLSHSSINFEATHLMLSKIPGRFSDFTGNVELIEKDFLKSQISFTVKVASIDTATPKRDEHLRSPDFFDTVKFPEAKFKSTSISESDEHFTIQGDLTIRNVTRPVSFSVKRIGQAFDPVMKVQKIIFQGSGEINRRDFGVSYGPDAIVSNKIALTFNFELMPMKKE